MATLKERWDALSPSHLYTMPRMSSLKSEKLVGTLQECAVVGLGWLLLLRYSRVFHTNREKRRMTRQTVPAQSHRCSTKQMRFAPERLL